MNEINKDQEATEMLKKCLLIGAFAAALVGASSAQSASPTPAQQQNPTQQQSTPTPAVTPAAPAPPPPQADGRSITQAASTTLSGCVYREEDVPGRKPNVVERAGILEDYVLATMVTTTTPGTAATPGATGTSGSRGAMYKLEKIDDNRLKALVGKRVEVTGRIDAGASAVSPGGTPKPDRGLGPDQIELPEFEVTSIKEIAGTCPLTPAGRQ